MTQEDIRWVQRFQNFEKAVQNLKTASEIKSPSEIERAGVIHFFEIAFELGWKTLSDYLIPLGYNPNSPRETIKQAFQIALIKNGHNWIEMLDKRNALTHTYDEETAQESFILITTVFLPNIIEVYEHLKSKIQ